MELRNKITLMAIAEIMPYENNPRNNEEAVEKVANSIKEFGFNQPIVVDKDNVIIVGHTRYLAAQQLGLNKVPAIVAANLSEEQARAYRLVDNKVGEIAGWDFEKLTLELEQIESIDMSEFGFCEKTTLDIDDEDFLSDNKIKEKEPKKVTCPHCGQEFEI
jgi:ParB family transcriptional regulator, chromosome partitioning protein